VKTDGDMAILPLALRKNQGFHEATKWYFRGWKPLPFQWAWHQLDTLNTTLIGGIAVGKTAVVTASNTMDCLTIPHFRALNTSVTAKQAELPFQMLMAWIEGNPKLEHLVHDVVLRPYPIVEFKNYSVYEFRTVGLDARFIRGFEYDRINFDEAGLDLLGAVIKVLRGRCRGTRPDGTTRMARLDVTSSPTAALWMKERFLKGIEGEREADLEQYRSLQVSTYMNTHLTKRQIRAMESEYSADMIDVELGANFPDFGMGMFPIGHVESCTDQSLYDAAYIALNPEEGKVLPGYSLDEDPRHGVTLFEMPVEPGRTYISAGDPGTDGYPKRNAPVVMVADVTNRPFKKLVYCWWGSGRGSFNPFLKSYRYVTDKYTPILRGIDASGTQKYVDEIAFENAGIDTDRLNFSSDKVGMLNNLSMDVSSHLWKWPPISGLIKQMSTYSLDLDDKSLPQDLVMGLAEISYLARMLPGTDIQTQGIAKANFRNRNLRTTHAPRRY